MTAGCTLTDVFVCHCSVRLCWNGAFFVRGWLTIRRTFRAFCAEQGKSELLAQWDGEKNAPLTPDDVTFGSRKRAGWRCPAGHSWQAMIYTRSAGTGCPYCANRKVLPGFNDLATVQPLVAKQWRESLNGALTPEMVTAGSHKKAWWQCPYGHVWKAVIYARTGAQQSGCPVCAGKTKTK